VQFTDYTAELSQFGSEQLDVSGFAEDTRRRLWLKTPRTLVCFGEGRFQQYRLTNAPFAGRLKQIAAHPQGGVGGGANVGGNWRFENPMRMDPGRNKPAGGARRFGCVGCVV
jgi:hypothetical protein